MALIPVILSGGSGSRLWPLSRQQYPKQLLNLTGGPYTMLQETVLRVGHLVSPIIVCNEDHRFMVAEQCHAIGVKPTAIILEPVGRNTAPAIALAAIEALKYDADASIAVLPADHVIADEQAFKQALEDAAEAAQLAQLVTFAIVADSPHTGYGYLRVDSNARCDAQDNEQVNAYRVSEFVEKPNQVTAQSYLDEGGYYWNSGMFVFNATLYLETLNRTSPAMVECCQQAHAKAQLDLDFLRIDKDLFSACPDDSIDYAVMEKADNVVAVILDAGWNDVGSWTSVWDICAKDGDNNVHVGDVLAFDSQNNMVHAQQKLVATLGVENLIIVDTKDALLIANKSRAQEVKTIVNDLQQRQREEGVIHRNVHRPWGSYELIGKGSRYQVKRITVRPGASLSLQMHYHRSEHWVVVSGTAFVEIAEKQQWVGENQSVYIPIASKHRLKNPGKLPLELIEVQSGSYLGEDDIVRFEDQFGRC